MIVDIVDKYLTDDNNPIKNLRLIVWLLPERSSTHATSHMKTVGAFLWLLPERDGIVQQPALQQHMKRWASFETVMSA